MTNYQIYKELEGNVLHGCSYHPTIVQDVGNSTPVDIEVRDGYAWYNGAPLRLTHKGWLSLYLDTVEGRLQTKVIA
jgi:hypothetical protein